MEEIALLIGFGLSVAVLTGMAQFSKNQLKPGIDICQSKLRLIHLADKWGRKLLKTGATLSIFAITLGLIEPSPHKVSVALIIAGLLILFLATLIIVTTFFGLPILIFGFKPLLQKFNLALKNTIPLKATLKFVLLGLEKFSLEAFKAFIGLFAWSIFVNLRDMENNSEEIEKKDFILWHGDKDTFQDPFMNHIDKVGP
ncbi:MAG: hypothetical protein ABL903_09040 [Methylococcales bacterium]